MSTDVFTFAKLHRQMHCKIFTVSMELVGRLWTALVSRQDWLCDVTKTLPLSRQRELISTSIQWNDLPSPFLSDIEITLYGSYFRKLSPVSIVSIPAALFFFFFFFDTRVSVFALYVSALRIRQIDLTFELRVGACIVAWNRWNMFWSLWYNSSDVLLSPCFGKS